MISACKRGLLAAVLATASTWAAESAPPVLALAIPNAVSRPGRNGRAPLARQLLVKIARWQSDAPEVTVLDPVGTAHVHKLDSAAGAWRATLTYETKYPDESAFSGEVELNLTIDDAIVRGTYTGSFNGTPLGGRVGAGLAWPLAIDDKQNLLLWTAHLKQPVRGIIVFGNGGDGAGGNGDVRQEALREDLQAMAASRGLAVVSTGGLPRTGAGPAIVRGLAELAAQTGHEELKQAPVFFIGHSNGGGMAADFNQWDSDRVGGYISSHGNGAVPAVRRALDNPGLFTAGENDPKISALGVESTFLRLRLSGARVALAVEQGGNHPMGPGSLPLFLFWLQHVIDQRLPQGAKALQTLDESRGWWADNATWNDGITAIQPASERGPKLNDAVKEYRMELINGHVDFHGLPGSLRFSWLPDKDVAYVYRGVATYNNPLKLSRSGNHAETYSAGERVEIECTDFGHVGWKRVTLYDGATLLGELTPEHARLALPRQKAGAHAGVLVGEMENGELRTSLPVAWVVWP